MSELKPCPFCGCKSKIVQCDDEGNVRGEEYESNPWSGLGYRVVHESDDCPISTGEEGYNLIYDSREQAVEAWNNRAERTCHNLSDFQDCDCFICSECGYSLGDPRWFYCPKCGGKITNGRSDT